MSVLNEKRTKILATLGPASSDETVIGRMIDAGLNAVRINTSHCDEGAMAGQIETVRRVANEKRVQISIVVDLQGPKIRLSAVPGDKIHVKPGDVIRILVNGTTNGDDETPTLESDYKPLADELAVGEELLIGDGDAKLLVRLAEMGSVTCEALRPGVIKRGKGITRPGRSFAADSLQPQDYEFIKLGCELEVDWFAVSFVRRASDMMKAREAVRVCGSRIPLIAKIEQPEAVRNLEEILDVSDGVMVARGDMGLFLPLEEVPMIQKRIIARAKDFAIPVITATQMLESMITNELPTRAEVSDVANAILDGTDAVMLSGETAVGAYPVDTIETMTKIALATEPSIPVDFTKALDLAKHKDAIATRMAVASYAIAHDLKSVAIVAPTESGFSARNVSRLRPDCTIIAPTPNLPVARRLALSYGVYAFLTESRLTTESQLAVQLREIEGVPEFEPGSNLVFIGGIPTRVQGITNFVKVEQVE